MIKFLKENKHLVGNTIFYPQVGVHLSNKFLQTDPIESLSLIPLPVIRLKFFIFFHYLQIYKSSRKVTKKSHYNPRLVHNYRPISFPQVSCGSRSAKTTLPYNQLPTVGHAIIPEGVPHILSCFYEFSLIFILISYCSLLI